MADYNRLLRHWTNSPPTYVILNAVVQGFGKSGATSAAASEPAAGRPTWETESIEQLFGRWKAVPGTQAVGM